MLGWPRPKLFSFSLFFSIEPLVHTNERVNEVCRRHHRYGPSSVVFTLFSHEMAFPDWTVDVAESLENI